MSDFLDGLESEMGKHSRRLEREDDEADREEERAARAEVDAMQALNDAKRKVTDERKITLDWAWAAAELLNASDKPLAQPDAIWYNHAEKRKWWFGHNVTPRVAVQGWHLVDWRNARYYPQTKHSLMLVPHDINNSGIHLRFFSQQLSGGDSTPELQPEDVHELSREPLSEGDMPWPGLIDPADMGDVIASAFGDKMPKLEMPWKDGVRSFVFDEMDGERELDLTGYRSEESERPRMATVSNYEEHLRAKTEPMIRRTIAQVAAERLSSSPRIIARELGRLAGITSVQE